MRENKMKRALITFVPDYYPSNTGFAQAFFHLHKSILVNDVCDRVYVFAEGNHTSPDSANIIVGGLPKVRGTHLLCKKLTHNIIQKTFENDYKEVFNQVDRIINESCVQMILVESMFLAWLIPILKRRYPSVPVVCRIHGTGPEYTAYYRKIDDIEFRDYLLKCVFESNNIAATTKYYFDFFQKYYKDYGKFIDKEFFLLPNTTSVEDSDAPINNTKKIFLLQLGRMDMRGYHQKGFQDTVKALMYIENLKPEVASKIVYITIGTGDREREFLERASNLKFVIHKHYSKLENSEVKKIEAQSNIILLPSRCEGMSMFGTEAIAAGKPIVGTVGNGLESICKDGYNGYLVSEYDYILMAEAIINIIETPGLMQKMSTNSAELFANNCSYSAVASKYEVIVRFLNNAHR